MSIRGLVATTEKCLKINHLRCLSKKLEICLLLLLHKGSISKEEFLILYEKYESGDPLYPYWEFDPFCLASD